MYLQVFPATFPATFPTVFLDVRSRRCSRTRDPRTRFPTMFLGRS